MALHGLAILSGMIQLFLHPWLGGIIFLLITVGLPLVGVFKKKSYLIFISFGILLFTFLFNFHLIPLFPHYIGAIEGAIITNGSIVLKIFYNFGLILIPFLVNLICLWFI